VLNQTSAKVDKVNREIELVVSETNANTEAISSLTLNTESIDASVSRIEENTEAALKDVNSAITDITNRVDMAISAEDVTIAIKNEMANGVEKITTGKGFTFNDTGLTIEEISDTTNNKIKTTITNNGMTVYANNDEMLVANDNGVVAKNLHANTYLIIGTKSRFEDYGERTGCFWIGG
jgi:ABC-type molybdate transport system ATPase subunit